MKFDPRIASRIPSATYRLQISKNFNFADAASILSYLERLGISDCYSSPVLKARRGSTHGYDVTDHSALNPELGDLEEFSRFAQDLKRRNMGLLLDIVPNHMAMSDENPPFMDVLENGRHSKYSEYFDIDWNSQRGKLLLPILGSELSDAINEHDISLGSVGKKISLNIYDSRLPISSKSQSRAFEILKTGGDLKSLLSQQIYQLEYWRRGIKKINYRRFSTVNDLIAICVERQSVYQESHKLILDLVSRGMVSGLRIDHIDGLFDPSGYLSQLQRDCQRLTTLSKSSSAGRRRAEKIVTPFFVVVEKILGTREKLSPKWQIHGTTGYEFLNDLSAIYVERKNSSKFDRIYSEFAFLSSYADIVGESKKKIIDSSMESDLSRLTDSLLAIPGQRNASLDRKRLKNGIREVAACFPVYRTYTDGHSIGTADRRYLDDAIRKAKLSLLSKKQKKTAKTIDFLRKVLLLDFPQDFDSDEKRKWITFRKRFEQFTAPISAKGVEDTAFYLYNRLISLNEVGGDPEIFGSSIENFHKKNKDRLRTHPHSLLATSTHDTKRSGDVRARINVLSEIPEMWESFLTNSSKTNSNRGIVVGGKRCPSANDEYMLYQTLLGVWPSEKITQNQFENLVERISSFMIKAIREEKQETSWLHPNIAYENGMTSFIKRILDMPEFISSLRGLNEMVSYHGMLNSLSQLLLQMTCPGVPDIYQGNEIWDYSLVDPDNRRGVDYGQRREMLSNLEKRIEEGRHDEFLTHLMGGMESGLIKMFVLNEVLKFRRAHRKLFDKGEYVPLNVTGAKRRHVCAFMRKDGEDECIVVAPRFFVSLLRGSKYDLAKNVWEDTGIVCRQKNSSRKNSSFSLSKEYCDLFTRMKVSSTPFAKGQIIRASEILDRFPVAFLTCL